MNKLQRRVGTGVLTLGVLSGLGGLGQPAHAAEKVDDTRYSFEYVMPGVDNPCTPELDDITMTVNGMVVLKGWTANDGSTRSQSHVRTHLAGEAADGTGYVGNDQFQAHSRIEDGVAYITADTKNRLVSQGADPNFTLRLKVRVSFDLAGPGSTFEVIKDQAECRG